MRQAIETAPRDGTNVILEDDASGTYDVAYWSAEAGRWISENGEPSKITPSHWHQRHGDYQYFLQENDRKPRRFAAFPIAVGLLVLGLMGLYFEVFDSLYFEVFHSETILPKQDSHKTDLALRQRAEADQARVKAGTQVNQAVEAPPRETRKSVMTGQSTESLTNGLAENHSAIDGLDRQLQTELANSAQSVEQDQQRITALAREATAARQELTASTEQHRQALEEERARSAALASELATAHRELDAQAAQLRKSSDEAARLKQAEAAKSAQSNEEERKKSAALAREATAARQELTASTEQHRQALEEERARSAALASELARREVEIQALQKAVEEAVQQKQAVESTIAKLRQSQQQERQRAEALSSELAEVRRELKALATLSRQKDDEAEQLKRVAETATAELQRVQQRDEAQALESQLAKVRQSADAQVATPGKTSEEAARTKHIETVRSDFAGNLRRQKSGETAPDQAVEDAKAELRPSVHHKPGQPKGITPNAETTRQSAGSGATEQSVSTQGTGSAAAGLLARAKALVGQGNISAARVVLERAAETGNAQATFALAETYDPNVLATWRTRRTPGDTTKARDLYAKAYGGGIKAAKDRAQALVFVGSERKPASWFGREEADDY
ncbi:hypothetical protein [Bradyrhizobium sp. sBnM-33]|uniref:hypothetical protein n=1 Tax=Bradyrhizobium sp. sBnM-33 TaxID=2831780 RepID=UPI001BCFFEF6|nr:hypothetical protein [Bradyrhizobium sp. sBnM-33]WOH53761.1 hypothetical protein RX328_17725 [Bradyrhizobium sp. sBnM-33]